MVDTLDFNPPLIMLIDDSVLDQFINNKVLTSYSAVSSIIEFSVGSEAIKYLVNHENDADKIPDIIFLDIYMPYMNGFEFLEAYKILPASIKSKITLFMLSSSLDPEDIRKANEDNNVKRLFQKPLTMQAVEEVTSLTTLAVRF